jgi:hypothetical protein
MGAMFDHDKFEVIRTIFPGTIGVSSDGWFMYLQLRTLPPKPWPLTIAEVPLYLYLKIS